MSLESHKQPANVTLQNQPRLSQHDRDVEKNEVKLQLVPVIEDYIKKHDLFNGQEVSVTFTQQNVSSLVAILESTERKFVLKVSLSNKRQGEAEFLKIWEGQNVKVPHVAEEGIFNSTYPYMLMEFIDAKQLRETTDYEHMIGKETFVDMGRTLHTMHIPEAEGFGPVIDGKASYSEFSEWLKRADLTEKIAYCQKHDVFTEEHGSLDSALETLKSFTKKAGKTSYCHNDFADYNIFDTEPLTVFDPNPSFNNRYIDLGMSIVIAIGHGGLTEAANQLIKGYFSESDPINKKALQAAILLQSHVRGTYWHQTKKLIEIENLRKYLIQNKHLLDIVEDAV
jgi:Ser/Thr protein kinase RdoA (MazF antagonist)